jgi:hypothetical protein
VISVVANRLTDKFTSIGVAKDAEDPGELEDCSEFSDHLGRAKGWPALAQQIENDQTIGFTVSNAEGHRVG